MAALVHCATFAQAATLKEESLADYNKSMETWDCQGATKENPSGQVTLVQQLANKKHILEIVPISGTIAIDEIRIHKPVEDGQIK